tara:strand:- start:315 stop:617 length:303 start_codon:yes stop_codon:yes gene_type:complete
MSTNPILCEPGIKYFLRSSLKESHKFKERYINFFFNIGMFGLFVIVLFSILYYRYKGKLTPSEIALKNRRKQEYIVSKLQQLTDIKKNNNMLTDLPVFDY